MSDLDNTGCFGTKRGYCDDCKCCEKFILECGSTKCAYCNCVPAVHEVLTEKEPKEILMHSINAKPATLEHLTEISDTETQSAEQGIAFWVNLISFFNPP